MSRWNHQICDACWEKREPGRVPYRVIGSEEELCCYCGTSNKSGIYVRQDPNTTPCEGLGGTHDEEDF